MQRYAPLFVVLAVLVVAGGAVVFGRLSPKPPPAVPGSGGSQAGGRGAGGLPADHPPIAVPEDVRQIIRDLADKAAAAPDDLDAWRRLAEVQYRAGQIERRYLAEAEKAYRHVLERQPDDLDVLRHLGNIAFDQERPEIAIDFYQRYLKVKPDDLNVRTDMATMFLASGQSAEAIRTYEAVLKTEPSFFQAQFNLALALRAAGQTEAAIAALEKARAIAPEGMSRSQVDQVLARMKNAPPQAPAAPVPTQQAAAGTGAADTTAAAAGTFQADVEAVFRQHPIVGPRVQRFEWSGAARARLYLRDFPMDQMDESMQAMFIGRMRERIKAQKDAHDVAQTATVELVDEATGKPMATLAE